MTLKNIVLIMIIKMNTRNDLIPHFQLSNHFRLLLSADEDNGTAK